MVMGCGVVVWANFGRVLKNRIQVLCHRSDLRNGGAAAAAAAAGAVRRQAGRDLAAHHALAAGSLIDQAVPVGDAAQRAPALSSLQRPFGAQRSVAIHLQIEIILDRQRDCVLHRQVQASGADQTVQMVRVARDSPVEAEVGHVRSDQQRTVRSLHRLRRYLFGRCIGRPEGSEQRGRKVFSARSSGSLLPLSWSFSGADAGIADSLATWPDAASSIEMPFTSSVCPTASSKATLACV